LTVHQPWRNPLGAVAVVFAAVSSGFVATLVIEQILTGPAEARPVLQALLTYLVNQGFAKVNRAWIRSGNLAQSVWLVWIGVLLCSSSPSPRGGCRPASFEGA
jgi:hypothetical protein